MGLLLAPGRLVSCYGQDVSLDLTLLVIYLYEERNVWALPGNLSRAPGIPEFSV